MAIPYTFATATASLPLSQLDDNFTAVESDITAAKLAIANGTYALTTPVLGTPSSGTVTNLTGTASININGTVGATTANTGVFTTATANSFIPNLSTIPTNGMYLPAANAVGFATNSTNAIYINSSQNVGVGTTAPGANHRLEIAGAQKYLAVTANTGYPSTANPSQSSGLFFGWNQSAGGGESNIVYGTGAGSTPALQFASWNGTTYAERMRIDASGNVGVGVVPNSWDGAIKAVQVNTIGAIGGSSSNFSVSANSYYNSGNDFYITNDLASLYIQSSGQHEWRTAPTGTAGASAAVISGRTYIVSVLGSSTLAQWQAFFSALVAIPTVGQVITATASGSIVGGGTVTQKLIYTQRMLLDNSGNVNIPALTASQAVFTDASKNLVSVATTGTGSVVLSDSPTFTTAITSTGALQLTGSATVNQNIATTQTTGSLTIGGTGATGAITLGQSTGAQNINISNGAASTSIVNIGGTGLSTGAINIGRSTGTQTINIGSGNVTTTQTRTINIGTTSLLTGISNVTIGKYSATVAHTTTINGNTITLFANTINFTGSALTVGPNLVQGTTAVGSLGALTGVVTGSRAFVSDNLVTPVFNAIVTDGSGSGFATPVFYDGTNWRCG